MGFDFRAEVTPRNPLTPPLLRVSKCDLLVAREQPVQVCHAANTLGVATSTSVSPRSGADPTANGSGCYFRHSAAASVAPSPELDIDS